VSQPPIFYKNPTVAVLLSFFLAGLGQLYNGQFEKGVLFIVGYIISLLLISIFVGFITTPLFWIFGMVDAYKAAISINEELARKNAGSLSEKTKKCPQCAELVKAEAHLCHFCRYEFPPPEEVKLQQGKEEVSVIEAWRVVVLYPPTFDVVLRELVRERFPGISERQVDDFLGGQAATVAIFTAEERARELCRRLESRRIVVRLEAPEDS